MDIDRNVKSHGLGKEGPVGFIVIETALVVVVYQSADKAELLNTKSKLVGRGCWVRYRDRGPATEA